MTAGIGGISPLAGINGFVKSEDISQATPEQRMGGTADPAHSQVGEVAEPYPWEEYPGETHGPYGIENDLLGFDFASAGSIMPAGQLSQDPTGDLTPRTHAAPWPKGVPQSMDPNVTAERQTELYDIHGIDMGVSRELTYAEMGNVQEDSWAMIEDTTPGVLTRPMADIPDQIKGTSFGWGSRDRVQSFARQNEYGFDSAHMQRRYADKPNIPGNYMWMEPGGRPMIKSVAGTSRPAVGEGPFEGQIPADAYTTQGAILQTLPATYEAPPTPALAPSYPSAEAPTVDFW